VSTTTESVDPGSAVDQPPAPAPADAESPSPAPASASGSDGGTRGRGRHRRRWPVPALAVVVAVVAATAGYGYVRATAPEPPAPLGPGDVTIELHVEHSLFDARDIRVYEGTRVRFVLDNGDPIGHELIVGGPEVHAKHEAGTHALHGSIVGEVSVGPNAQAVTTFRFDDPGPVEFACHLPGHYQYGMHGTIEVVAR
jgi:uncharacterized cupredoxin-like copper-binding protein